MVACESGHAPPTAALWDGETRSDVSDGSTARTPVTPGGFDVAHARSLAAGNEPLPPRPDALALATQVEMLATQEGAGSRAAELYTIAAKILERVWRVEGQGPDASGALLLYRAASRDLRAPAACDAAFRGARLAGDVGHDATTTFAELYRVKRRFAASPATNASATGSTCLHDVDASLVAVAAFRPSQRVLDEIDEALAASGEGALAVTGAFDASTTPEGPPPRIVRIESWPGRDSARVVVVLDRASAYRVGDETLAGASQPRTFVELDGVDVGEAAREVQFPGIVPRVRADPTTTGTRVSLDLDGHAWRRVFHLQEPYRIVVDVARRPPGKGASGQRGVARVVIDPGHGGKDNGAVGPSGIVEKDVTLDIAHRVSRVLVGQGVEVLLTRDDDRFITLEGRTARANAFGADLFVSIHCNASEGRTRRGIETFVLDTTRDEIAARVAARENATTQAATFEIASMLRSMRLADQARRSTRFAALIERAVVAAARMRFDDIIDGGVHFAGFYVLVGARMPGVLFEASYLSNATDEQRLGSEEYRQILSDGIVNGIKAYREGR